MVIIGGGEGHGASPDGSIEEARELAEELSRVRINMGRRSSEDASTAEAEHIESSPRVETPPVSTPERSAGLVVGSVLIRRDGGERFVVDSIIEPHGSKIVRLVREDGTQASVSKRMSHLLEQLDEEGSAWRWA